MKYKKVGKRLRELRGSRTQKEMASAIGVSLRAYQHYESGERIPPHMLLSRIASKFGKKVEWITELQAVEELKEEALQHPTSVSVRARPRVSKGEYPVIMLIDFWIHKFWQNASKEEKIRFEVQFEKCFPQFRDWLDYHGY